MRAALQLFIIIIMNFYDFCYYYHHHLGAMMGKVHKINILHLRAITHGNSFMCVSTSPPPYIILSIHVVYNALPACNHRIIIIVILLQTYGLRSHRK